MNGFFTCPQSDNFLVNLGNKNDEKKTGHRSFFYIYEFSGARTINQRLAHERQHILSVAEAQRLGPERAIRQWCESEQQGVVTGKVIQGSKEGIEKTSGYRVREMTLGFRSPADIRRYISTGPDHTRYRSTACDRRNEHFSRASGILMDEKIKFHLHFST